nr:ORF2 [Tilapia parvovirus]
MLTCGRSMTGANFVLITLLRDRQDPEIIVGPVVQVLYGFMDFADYVDFMAAQADPEYFDDDDDVTDSEMSE